MLSSMGKGTGAVLPAKILATIERHKLLETGDRALLALSGGPDSVALLLALDQLKESLSLQLSSAHVNHQLRGQESDDDENFVRQLCRRLNVPLEVKRVDTRRAASKGGANLEDCARRIRYQFLFELAREGDSRVVTAHTLDDQAETFLMKLFRGAGPAGLSGIYPLRVNQSEGVFPRMEVRVVRPLLDVTRSDILAYLEEKQQTYRLDRSNQDLDLDRNWVRHELIPLLERKLNPRLVPTLQRAAGLFREIEDFLMEQGKAAFQQCRAPDRSEIVLRLRDITKHPSIIQKELVRLAIARSKGDLRDVTLGHVREVLRLIQGASGREVHLPGGLRAQREFDHLRFTSELPSTSFSYELNIPGELLVREVGKRIFVRRVEARPMSGTSLRVQWGGTVLTVRNRRPGDRYRTSLESSDRKLKELFQRRRVPRSERDKLLILEAEGKILWVEGFPPHPEHQAATDDEKSWLIEISNETLGFERLLN